MTRQFPTSPRIVAAFAVTILFFVGWRVSSPSPDRPVDAVLVDRGWADESTCAECHEQAETFWSTGHARTLMPAADDESRRLLQYLADTPEAVAEGLQIDPHATSLVAVHEQGGRRHELNLDWCFGSGEHARTWVGMLDGSWGATDLVEFRWSWYHATEGFAVTPGQPDQGVGGYFHGLGVMYDHPKTRRCFACHVSYLSLEDGRLDGASLKPGVTCQRCHGLRGEHVASGGEVADYFWRDVDQHESVNRCAQCHRRADEQKPDDIRTDNVDIVRFQPVGLVQSACYLNSDMTCITCHDPHRPLDQQDSLGLWQCVQCHDPDQPTHTLCDADHRDDCLSCHMPKVRMPTPQSFTDHWIRVRDADESQP